MTAVRLHDIWPTFHGSTSGYAKGCRCPECRHARTTASRQWRRANVIMPRGNPVAANGDVYPSENAAARVLGIHGETVRYHLDRHGDLSRVGQNYRGGCPNGGRKTPFCAGGRSWPSVSAFARYAGVSRSTARRWVKAGDLNNIIAAMIKADAQAAQVEIAA